MCTLPSNSASKPSCSAGDLGLIPRLGRSPGEGIRYPLQYSGLENSMGCIVHGVVESDTTEQLSLHLQRDLGLLGNKRMAAATHS